jgi:hypothetical protein
VGNDDSLTLLDLVAIPLNAPTDHFIVVDGFPYVLSMGHDHTVRCHQKEIPILNSLPSTHSSTSMKKLTAHSILSNSLRKERLPHESSLGLALLAWLPLPIVLEFLVR